MRKLLLTLFSAVLFIPLSGQELNQIVMDSSINREILLGYCNRSGFENSLFNDWFSAEYNSYSVDTNSLASVDFENKTQPEITIIMGTWCSDSRREIPRLYKILDQLGYDEDNLTLITVNRKKTAGDIPVEDYEVELVPTIIFYEGGEEIGRIIESPDKSLEKDIAKILAN